MGASAVYILSRKNRLYTVSIITKDSTVMNTLPSIVTSHRGMLARNPTSSMAVLISSGSVTDAPVRFPRFPATVLTMPPQMVNSVVIMSMP